MSEFDLLSVAADGMSVQRSLLDVAARNVAAAQASTPAHPYPRLVARFASAQAAGARAGDPDGIPEPGEGGGDGVGDADANDRGAEDDDAPRTRFLGTARGGESADALTELIAVLDAQRAYEANASVFDVGKRLAERTLTVGQG